MAPLFFPAFLAPSNSNSANAIFTRVRPGGEACQRANPCKRTHGTLVRSHIDSEAQELAYPGSQYSSPMLPLRVRIPCKAVQIDGSTVIDQPDLLPVPSDSEERKWNSAHIAGYWVAISFGTQYQIASTAVVAGLSPGAAIGAVFLGNFLISLACAATGWIGATYGINFPVLARASFGVYGNTIPVLARAVSGVAWFGLNTYQGGQCLQAMLGAIFPSFKHFKNHLPASAHVTSSELLCFFIFYIIQLPLLYVHITKLRHFFTFKFIIMPIFGITLFGWAVGRAHGFGPLFSQKTNTHGSPIALIFLSGVSSAIAGETTMALNVSDFTRYAKSPRVVVCATILSMSIFLTLAAILGVVVTSAVQVIYGISTWNPLQVGELWDSRAAQFFAAFCWALSAIGSNVAANSTAVGNDLAILFPRYYICALVALATCPWIIQNSANSFTGGYTIFLAPLCGIMLADYYILQRKHLHLPALYHCESFSRYWFTYGVNWRAVLAFILALVPNLPGFAAKINTGIDIPVGAKYIFALVWPVGIFVGGVCYLLLSACGRKEKQNLKTLQGDDVTCGS
ncbi:permease for cytosine/purines, uracil, thiamine, allantoin-domain-containing protein [Roridomyces roridus]|uniref:Permease for cytosine/purines, uracil, thiamine, allantoin-domain-containing protein n=1 Tax=Roridomyces roridus TaxID=1738132 RepID=A0AAD7BPI8_9AGAR|nr:permease for cytosine/purines, uracil, thiamine, allantoin-domain-containing protein [Roridomyces roridus]